MQRIRIEHPRHPLPRRPDHSAARPRGLRCPRHRGVHMVLAGSNPAWNTVRYLCPLCNSMGLPALEVAFGVVSAYISQRGYGFIDNGGPRIFFHVSDLVGAFTPYPGQPVSCFVEQTERGLIGRQVSPQ